jgi:hypothetical protein
LAAENQKIYIADHRMNKPQELTEVDTLNKIRNIECFSENSLNVIDDENLFFLDPRKGGLVSVLVHNIGELNK